MKLYFAKGACSLGIRITINELGIPCEFESVNLKTKQTINNKNYYDINPKGSVPALELDDGKVLTENITIQQYLAETNKASKLLPAIGDLNRYRVLEWLSFIATDLHKSCAPFFNPAIPADLKESIFKPILRNKLDFANKHLKQNKYLLNEQYTLADSYLFVILMWLQHFQINLSDWPNLLRYHNELKNRASIKKSLQQEELG